MPKMRGATHGNRGAQASNSQIFPPQRADTGNYLFWPLNLEFVPRMLQVHQAFQNTGSEISHHNPNRHHQFISPIFHLHRPNLNVSCSYPPYLPSGKRLHSEPENHHPYFVKLFQQAIFNSKV